MGEVLGVGRLCQGWWRETGGGDAEEALAKDTAALPSLAPPSSGTSALYCLVLVVASLLS